MTTRLAFALALLASLAACKGDNGGGGGGSPQLTVNVIGNGTVTSSPAGINCPSQCTSSFTSGASITLTATPGSGSTFTGWSGGSCSGSSTCTLTLSSNMQVSATFTAGSAGNRTLLVSFTGTGSGTVTSTPAGISCTTGSVVGCSASFSTGQQVTLAETPVSAQTFNGWSGACSGNGTCTVTMSADQNVTASFSGSSGSNHTLTVGFSGYGQGSVTSTPAGINCTTGNSSGCSAAFASGSSVTLTATAMNGGTFNSWSGACTPSGNTCAATMSADLAVTAQFTSGYVLTVAPGGDGSGSVTSSPAGINCITGSATGCSFDFGPNLAAPVNLTVAPSATSTFAGWSFGGCSGSGYATTCPISLNNNGVSVGVFFSAWQIRYPFPISPSSLVAYGGTNLLAAGKSGGLVTSTDGAVWTGHVVHGGKAVNAVATNGSGLFVGVCDAGAIVTTTDFSTITSISPVTTQTLNGLAYGGGVFVGAGANGTIVRSADGTSWTTATQGTQDLLGVAYGGGQFVAVGYGGTILTSPDGSTWTLRGAGLTTQFLTAATYDSTPQYVIVGNAGTVLTSPDAATWTSQTSLGGFALRGVAWAAGTYVAAGDFQSGSNNAGEIFTSTNAQTWTGHNSQLWQEKLVAVQAAGGRLYALGAAGSIARSSDGTGASWTQAMAGSDDLGAIAYGNSTYVAAGGHALGIFSSSDGISWTSRFAQPCCGGNFPSAAYGSWTTPSAGKAFVIAVENTIFSSVDGITWPSSPAFSTTTGTYLIGVVYGGGQFVVVGFRYNGASYTGVVVTSPDGVTWTDRTSAANITSEMYAVAWGGGQYVATGVGASISPDGVTWTPYNDQSADLMASMAYGAGLFVALDGSTGADSITSPDGVHWTPHHYAFSIANGYGNALAFGNGQFLAPTLATSIDGLTWTTNPYPTGGQFAAGVYGPGGWVGVGNGMSFWTHP